MAHPLVRCLAAALLVALSQAASHMPGEKVVVCYVAGWAVYRTPPGAFLTENIDPFLCTHLVYSFAGLDPADNTIRSLDPFLDLEENYGKGNYKKMTALKRMAGGPRVSLAVGGWNEGSANFSKMAADPVARANFTTSAIALLKKHSFDGLDMDWEFPSQRGGEPADKQNFVLLIKELSEALHAAGMTLTAAISANPSYLRQGYDLAALYPLLDHVHVMSYDYHGPWDNAAGPNAPLSSSAPDDLLTMERSLDYLLREGLKADKVVLGLPLYGRTFSLAEGAEPAMGAVATAPGPLKGPYTKSEGFLGYHEICLELNAGGWEKRWDNASSTPYAFKGDLFLSYDDPASIALKVKLATSRGLAGVMVWSMDTDDFSGACGEGRYPLLSSVRRTLSEPSPRPTTPPAHETNEVGGATLALPTLLFLVPLLLTTLL